MKKCIAFISVALFALICVCAQADQGVSDIDDALFVSAKQALSYFAGGDYSSASDLLGFADSDELQKFVEGNFTTMGAGIQTKVSVAYWTGGSWYVAVPLYAPDSADVEVLSLISDDGESFSGYQYTTWGNVESAYSACDYAVWNEEYIQDTPFVLEDN